MFFKILQNGYSGIFWKSVGISNQGLVAEFQGVELDFLFSLGNHLYQPYKYWRSTSSVRYIRKRLVEKWTTLEGDYILYAAPSGFHIGFWNDGTALVMCYILSYSYR